MGTKFLPGKSVFFTLVFALLLSCTKEFELDKLSTENLAGEWAFPLVKSTLTLDDLISDTAGIIQSGEDGLITLVYKTDNLVSMDGKERTKVPDQEKFLNKQFEMPVLPLNVSAEIPLTFEFEFEMVDENHRIDTLFMNNGMYNIGIETNLNKDEAVIELTVTNFVHLQTGDPLKVSYDLNNPGGEMLNVSSEMDLTAYYAWFDRENQGNMVTVDAVIHFTTDDNSDLSPYFVNLENGFTNVEFSKFFGFIGENEESFADTIDIGIFNSTDFSSISFGPESVRLNFDVYNSLGIPTVLEISRFVAYNTVNQPDSMELTIIPGMVEIYGPDIHHVNEYKHTMINTEFVNINEILGISPDNFYIEIIGHLNKDAPSETVNHFTSESNLYVDVSLEIDLFAGISEFVISDTLDFDATSFENVEAMEFMVNVSNGFPISANIQFDFVDAGQEVLFQLIEANNDLIQAAMVGPGPGYHVTDPGTRTSFILLDKEQISQIGLAENIIFSAVLFTDGNQYVKIYDHYSMDVNIGAKVIYSY